VSERTTPYFDRFCIYFLSFEWIFFGSMHFSFREATIAQMPDWLPAKPTLAVFTGILEVATGILILVPSARKWAAVFSLCLLAALLPAVFQILASDDALMGPPAFQMMFRLALLPNNILLAICSVHLLNNPIPSVFTAVPAVTDSGKTPGLRNTGKATLLVAFLLLASNCAGFLAILSSGIQNYATANLWAMACIAIGAFIGFLFAVPRVNPAAKTSSYLLPNTNIETVSDWLTKIIVGVGLINLKEIGAFLDRTSGDLAVAISPASSSGNAETLVATYKPFATALVVYFFTVGLIQGYLLTRMYLSWQFSVDTENFKARSEAVPID
jgi:uncharacterized membrane protein